jgi:thiamine pyrophosphokinase
MNDVNPTISRDKQTAILVLGGVLEDRRVLSQLLDKEPLIVAADRGVHRLLRFNITPHVLVGDLDSVTVETAEMLRQRNVQVVHESDQESTDFEKALRWLKNEGVTAVHVLGIEGGTSDHALTNFSVMLRYTDEFEPLIAYDQANMLSILFPQHGELNINHSKGTRVSLIPLPKAKGITTSGLLYPLHNEDLEFGVRDGLGNQIVGEDGARVVIREGALLVSVGLDTASQ